MSAAVLVSIRPPFTQWIFCGNKSLEWRGTEMPAGRAYIYETKNGGGCGKVIGEIVINEKRIYRRGETIRADHIYRGMISTNELAEYCEGKSKLVAHMIESAELWAKPRDVTEFRRVCQNDLYCESCAMFNANKRHCGNAALYLKRPPQSWCYVEDQISELAKAMTRAVAIAGQIPPEMLWGKRTKNEE